jgi:hypothetical protein
MLGEGGLGDWRGTCGMIMEEETPPAQLGRLALIPTWDRLKRAYTF